MMRQNAIQKYCSDAIFPQDFQYSNTMNSSKSDLMADVRRNDTTTESIHESPVEYYEINNLPDYIPYAWIDEKIAEKAGYMKIFDIEYADRICSSNIAVSSFRNYTTDSEYEEKILFFDAKMIADFDILKMVIYQSAIVSLPYIPWGVLLIFLLFETWHALQLYLLISNNAFASWVDIVKRSIGTAYILIFMFAITWIGLIDYTTSRYYPPLLQDLGIYYTVAGFAVEVVFLAITFIGFIHFVYSLFFTKQKHRKNGGRSLYYLWSKNGVLPSKDWLKKLQEDKKRLFVLKRKPIVNDNQINVNFRRDNAFNSHNMAVINSENNNWFRTESRNAFNFLDDDLRRRMKKRIEKMKI